VSGNVEVRFGLVGAGAISTQHAEAMGAVEGARLVAIASASAERARAAAERWGVAWEPDYAGLLARDDIDAVAICTPSGLHAEQAIAAVRAGKHVLIEKPLALSVAEADAVVEEARRQGRVAGMISQRRMEPVMQRLHQAVAAGSLGRLALIVAEGLYSRPQSYYDSAPWRGTRSLDGGVLMNQGIHMVDLVRWMGGPVESVTGQVATLGHEMEAEDTATVTIRFANGTLGEIFATTCAQPGIGQRLHCYGDAGHVTIAGEEPLAWDVPGLPAPTREATAATPSPAPVPGSPSGPGTPAALAPATWGTDATGHIRQYTDFVAAIRDGRPPAVTAQDGRDAIAIVTAAYESDRTGRTVTLGEGAR
jgi:UDP-N-acetyl-2-amino-2-deoxyglucuronate dehydrogenase